MHMSRQPTGTPNIPSFRLSLGLGLLLAAGVLYGVTPRPGSRDPEFTRLPFHEWAVEGRQSGIHWTVEIGPPALSTHQRLMVRTTITVDGRELEKRRGKGELSALIQFEDSAGGLWQNHTSLNLETVRKGVSGNDLQISQYAFLLPGDYSVSMAICDTSTLEHSFTVRRLRVAPLKDDPLPDAWADLPQVEFIRADSGPPDIWFLPEVAGRLNLPVAVKRPVHIEVLVNATPSQRSSGSVTAMRRNMSLLIPALKALSQVRLSEGTIDAALLDLTHRRIAWEQKDIRELDWNGMRRFLADNEPGKIDIRALEGERKMRQFFSDEVVRRLERPESTPHLVIVLSGPAFFEDQEAVESAAVQPNPRRRLIYIRDRSVFTRPMRLRPGYRPSPMPQRMPDLSMPLDDLEQTLQPLSPRVYDSATAEQFRRILAAVLQQTAAM